ncbi:hypothetical protein MVEN_02580700 [Mycena venus]|uniref:Thioesterase domain-containing protein n=1 Tax=Mycena venus TaxID=2733690 RepID=A0A8H6WT78_9AGAR|nr:hypothetical protein MVEN_02580700 [Mycena venus]
MRFSKDIDQDIKNSLSDLSHVLGKQPNSNQKPEFGDFIVERLVVIHASVQNKSEDLMKKEGRVVCEIVVTEEMLNGGGNIHGGCSAFLIDMCMLVDVFDGLPAGNARLAISEYRVPFSGHTHHDDRGYSSDVCQNGGLYQYILVYALTTVAEQIWNTTKHRMVASGVHVKMQPSGAKL